MRGAKRRIPLPGNQLDAGLGDAVPSPSNEDVRSDLDSTLPAMIFGITLGALFLIAGCLLGFILLRFLPMRLGPPEIIAAAIVVGLFAAAWVILLGIWILGYSWGLPCALLALEAGIFLGWVRRRVWRHSIPKRWFRDSRERLVWVVTTILVGAFLLGRFVAQMLWTREGAYFSATNTWGDLALHLSLLTRFAFESHFTWDFPVFHTGRLSYPFLIDFLSGILHRFGWSLQWALIVPGFALAFSFVQMLYLTVSRWFRSSAAAVLAVLLFLANGAPAGAIYFWRDWQASRKGLFEFLKSMDKMYAHLPDQGLHFSNVVTDYLLPQRSILFGLPLFLFISILFREAWRRPSRSKRLLFASAILAGLLPFAHVHAFFVVMGLWGWLAVVQSLRHRPLANAWIGFGALALALAAPQLGWQFLGSYSGRFSHWQLWWLKPPGQNPAVFWLRNLGVALPLGLWILIWLWRTKASRGFYLHFGAALTVLFLFTNLYQFQPNMFDNMKFMVFSYLTLSIFLGYLLARWLAWSRWTSAVALLCVLSLSIPGLLSILKEMQVSWMFSTPEEIAVAKVFRQVIPTEARILTSDQHNHFVPVLTGRRIVMGYRGWLWSYGIDYGQTEQDVAAMYAGGPRTALLLERYGVSYVCVGPSERSLLNANEAFFNTHYPLAIRSGPFLIYDVSHDAAGKTRATENFQGTPISATW
jgi:hypothetical protein